MTENNEFKPYLIVSNGDTHREISHGEPKNFGVSQSPSTAEEQSSPNLEKRLDDSLLVVPENFKKSTTLDPKNEILQAEEMSNITREEFDAKLALLQKEMEHKDELFDQKLDAFLGKQALHDDKFLILAQQTADTAKKAENLKTHLWTSALAIGLTAIGTLVGSYYSSQQILLSASQIVSEPLKDDIRALSESQKTLAENQQELSKNVEAIRTAVERPKTSSSIFGPSSSGSFSIKPEPETKNNFVKEK